MYVLFPLFFDFYPVMRRIYAGSSAGMKKDDFLSLFYPALSYHFKKTDISSLFPGDALRMRNG